MSGFAGMILDPRLSVNLKFLKIRNWFFSLWLECSVFHAYSLAHPISPLQCLLSVSPCLSQCALNLCAAHSAQSGGRDRAAVCELCWWVRGPATAQTMYSQNATDHGLRVGWWSRGLCLKTAAPSAWNQFTHLCTMIFWCLFCKSVPRQQPPQRLVWSVSMHFILTGLSACSNSIVPRGEEMLDFYGCSTDTNVNAS